MFLMNYHHLEYIIVSYPVNHVSFRGNLKFGMMPRKTKRKIRKREENKK